MPRHFLILFDEFPIIAADVKSGNNQPEVVIACRCVNAGLFISNDLRRDVILSIAFGNKDDIKIISFPGDALRRVSPDERSVSFFLLKAMDVLENLGLWTSKTMNNGIITRRMTLQQLLDELAPECIYIASAEPYSATAYPELDCEGLFVYDFSSELSNGFDQIIDLARPSAPERFVLDVNMWFDEK